jgi:hypothetical protein
MPLVLTKRDGPLLLARGFSQHFVNSLPEAALPRFPRCAVVSNAPSLRFGRHATNLSREIDSADAVFRINRGRVAGFEPFVGSKETFRFINFHKGVSSDGAVLNSLKKPVTLVIRDELYRRWSPRNISDAWNRLRFSKIGALDEYMQLRTKHPNTSIYMNHPVFAEFSMRYLHTTLFGSNNTRPLSTGSEAVLLAAMLCEKVTSYEVCSTDPVSSNYKYYYDEKKGSGYKWWHPMTAECSLLQFLSTKQRPNSSIYEYDMRSGADMCSSDRSGVA